MNQLEKLRHHVDKIDEIIISKISQRFAISKKIGQLKRKKGEKVKDRLREKKLKTFHRSLSKAYKLPQLFIEKLFSLILKESRHIQKNKKK